MPPYSCIKKTLLVVYCTILVTEVIDRKVYSAQIPFSSRTPEIED